MSRPRWLLAVTVLMVAALSTAYPTAAVASDDVIYQLPATASVYAGGAALGLRPRVRCPVEFQSMGIDVDVYQNVGGGRVQRASTSIEVPCTGELTPVRVVITAPMAWRAVPALVHLGEVRGTVRVSAATAASRSIGDVARMSAGGAVMTLTANPHCPPGSSGSLQILVAERAPSSVDVQPAETWVDMSCGHDVSVPVYARTVPWTVGSAIAAVRGRWRHDPESEWQESGWTLQTLVVTR